METLRGLVDRMSEAKYMAEIIVGILAFFGAYLGSKRIKKHLIDSYIEARVTKALEVNEKVLLKVRSVLSDLEQTYVVNRHVSEEDLDDVIDQCKEIANLSVDGGKEVSTVAYLLYHTVENLKSRYERNAKYGNASERLSTGSFIGLVDRSLRLIIEYCNTSTPIPFKTSLVKRSMIKRGLRKFLSDKGHYSLKHHPFGLTLNPNSEVILRFSGIVGSMPTALFRKKLFMLLQSNLPIVYELIAEKIYMPVVLGKQDDIEVFGRQRLHLVKVQSMRTIGTDGGDYFDFFYSNISPMLKFVDSYQGEDLRNQFSLDEFTKTRFLFGDYQKIEWRVDETIKITVDAKRARENYRILKWRVRGKLFQQRFQR